MDGESNGQPDRDALCEPTKRRGAHSKPIAAVGPGIILVLRRLSGECASSRPTVPAASSAMNAAGPASKAWAAPTIG